MQGLCELYLQYCNLIFNALLPLIFQIFNTDAERLRGKRVFLSVQGSIALSPSFDLFNPIYFYVWAAVKGEEEIEVDIQAAGLKQMSPTDWSHNSCFEDVIESAERHHTVRAPRPQDHARAPEEDGLDEEGEEQGVRQGERRPQFVVARWL